MAGSKEGAGMKNINIEIPAEIHKSLKLSSVKEDTTLKEIIKKILSE